MEYGSLGSQDDDLRFSIELALMDVPIPMSRREKNEIWRKIVADLVLKHLRMANWKITRGLPAPAHGRNASEGTIDGSYDPFRLGNRPGEDG